MSESQPDPTPGDPTPDDPTAKQVRDARRHAHGVQKDNEPDGGGSKKARNSEKKGRKGKGGRQP